MQTVPSLGVVWEEAFALFKAEAQLIVPVAFAGFGLPLVALQLAAPQPLTVDGDLVTGWWLAWLLPWAVASMIATMAISALALRPGLSVGEALRHALSRLRAGVGLVALALAGIAALSIAASIVAGIEAALTGKPGVLFTIALLGMFVAIIATLVRVLPIWAVLIDGPPRPMAALRHAFALTRRGYLKLLLLRVVAWLAQTLALFVLLMPIAVVFALLGKATGQEKLFEVLALVAAGAVLSGTMALWTVYVARLYRRLSSSGI